MANFRPHSIKMIALLLIDIQQGLQETKYYGTERNNPDAEKNCGRILKSFREKGLPVFHVKHNSTNPKSPLHQGKMEMLSIHWCCPWTKNQYLKKR